MQPLCIDIKSRAIERQFAAERCFVGRGGPIALFESGLSGRSCPFRLLYVHGHAGVGKSHLLSRFGELAVRAGVAVSWASSLRLDELNGSAARHVVFVDGAVVEGDGPEELTAIFERLPAGSLLIIASREAPPLRWRAQAAWSALARVVHLDNFDELETLAYVASRDLLPADGAMLRELTRGHPLSLALACSCVIESPHIVDAEHHQVCASVGRAMIGERDELRDALEAAAVVRCTREDVLAALLGDDRANATFPLLARLPFVERGADGLSLLPFVRWALLDELRWRNPARFQRLEEKARQYYATRLRHRGVAERNALLRDLSHLFAPNGLRTVFEVRDLHRDEKLRTTAATLVDDDSSEVVHQIHRAYAIGEQVAAVRHASPLQQEGAGEANDMMRGHLQREAPLSVGQWANVTQLWVTEPHDALRAVLVDIGADALEESGPSVTFIVTSQPRCSALLERCGIPPLFEDRQRHDQSRHIHACDWRRTSPEHWLELISRHDMTAAPPAAAAHVMLTKNEFAAAVRQALRDFNQPSALRANALLRARLVHDELPAKHDVGHRVAALRRLLRRASDELGSSAKHERLVRVLVRTYFDAAPSQERAAESLDLPLSTYRRYLKKAVHELVEALWQIELGGPRGQID